MADKTHDITGKEQPNKSGAHGADASGSSDTRSNRDTSGSARDTSVDRAIPATDDAAAAVPDIDSATDNRSAAEREAANIQRDADADFQPGVHKKAR
jgi:hypothetical protein